MEELERIHKETIDKLNVEHEEILENDKIDTQFAMKIMKQHYEKQAQKPDESENSEIEVCIYFLLLQIVEKYYKLENSEIEVCVYILLLQITIKYYKLENSYLIFVFILIIIKNGLIKIYFLCVCEFLF